MYQLFHVSNYAALLEEMVRDIAVERDGFAL